MKRFILIPLTALLFCLGGCAKKPPTLSDSFTLEFQTAYNGLELSGELSQSADGTQIRLNGPYTVDGLRFDYANEQLRIGYTSLETRSKSDYLPEASLPCRIYNAMLYLSQAQYTGSENSIDVFTVPTPQGDMTITAVKGTPTGMTLPRSGIKLHFNSVTEQ